MVQSLDHDWNGLGNLVSIHKTGPGVDQWQCYKYNGDDRLTNAYTSSRNCSYPADNTGPDPYQVSYTYHPNGNIKSASGTGTPNDSYGYGAGPAGPHAVTSAGGNTYGYDNGGNQVTRTVGGQSTALNYDIQNRLIGMVGDDEDLAALYDASGNRAKRSIGGVDTFYLGEAYEIRTGVPVETGGSSGTTTTTTQPSTTSTTAATTTTTAAPSTTTVASTTTTTTSTGSSLSVLLVVANPGSLTAAESAFKSHLDDAGHAVTVIDDGAPEPSASFDLVWVATSSWIGSKYRSTTAGLINTSGWEFHNHGFVVGAQSSNPWTAQATITSSGHPLTAGLSGTVSLLASPNSTPSFGSASFGTASPTVIAETSSGQASVFAYEAGDAMADGVAAGSNRVAISSMFGPGVPSADGWVLIDNAITWTTNTSNTGTGGTGGTGTGTGTGTGGGLTETQVVVSHRVAGHLIGQSVNGQYVAVLVDHLGSSGGQATADGVTTLQRYTPFGVVRGGAGNQLDTDYTFTGQTNDPGTGLIDYNARHYDPLLGRFVMADTVLDGLNRYTYVANNPLRFTDPTGHCRDSNGHRTPCDSSANVTGNDGGERLARELNSADLYDAGKNSTHPEQYATQAYLDGSGSYAKYLGALYAIEGLGSSSGPSLPSWLGPLIVELGLLAASSAPVVGEGIDGFECYQGFGWNWETGWDCGSAFVPIVGGRWDNVIRFSRRCSFSGETEVLMADGTTKPISQVKVGDFVLAEDPETGERGAREVTHLWIHQDTIIDLEIGGHDVATTEDHPFWNHTDAEWQRADALDPGDLVLTADGSMLTVDGFEWESARTTAAYNLTVNDIHSYFVAVGNEPVLVHNVCFDDVVTTSHGRQRLAEAGFDGLSVDLLRASDTVYEQADGALSPRRSIGTRRL